MHKYTALVSLMAEGKFPRLEECFDVFFLPPAQNLAKPVSSHADMLVFNCGHDTVLYADYAKANPSLVSLLADRCAQSVILSKYPRKAEYPCDIALNALECDGGLLALTKYCADEVKSVALKHSLELVNVRQGYCACSALKIKGAVVSADRSILKAAEGCGVDTLEISPGGIVLEGYNEGFIGGASGVCDDTVYFLGNIDTHSDAKKIREFLQTHGYNIICLGEGPLEDIGGIKFFKNYPSNLA